MLKKFLKLPKFLPGPLFINRPKLRDPAKMCIIYDAIQGPALGKLVSGCNQVFPAITY